MPSCCRDKFELGPFQGHEFVWWPFLRLAKTSREVLRKQVQFVLGMKKDAEEVVWKELARNVNCEPRTKSEWLR